MKFFFLDISYGFAIVVWTKGNILPSLMGGDKVEGAAMFHSKWDVSTKSVKEQPYIRIDKSEHFCVY